MGAALLGVEGVAIEVEVRVSSRLPRIDIVGLPEACVRESGARVRAAIGSTGRRFPDGRITVNLAPAALRKSGAGLDLPIALGLLAAANVIEGESLRRRGFIGELALDGRLRPVRGALAMALAIRDSGCAEAIVPVASAGSAALAPGIDVFEAADLESVIAHLLGLERLDRTEAAWPDLQSDATPCISDVRGQQGAKRALEVAAGGGHGLLFYGPPGTGKTMLASRLPGLLPPLSSGEALESTRIYEAAGLLSETEAVVAVRPFRAPHHTASSAGLLGGGNPPRPGEVSLAHRGVLFLDEMPEFERRTLEALRQVLEERRITLARASFSCTFPADFMLVGAANPCPCGWYLSQQRDCRCELASIERYRRRISGPLLDRIDLHVWLPALAWSELERPAGKERSREMRARVVACRARQRERGVASNARIPDGTLDEIVDATPDARALLGRAVDRLQLSARAARRILRIARTIADLADDRRVDRHSMAEALTYRGERTPGG